MSFHWRQELLQEGGHLSLPEIDKNSHPFPVVAPKLFSSRLFWTADMF